MIATAHALHLDNLERLVLIVQVDLTRHDLVNNGQRIFLLAHVDVAADHRAALVGERIRILPFP